MVAQIGQALLRGFAPRTILNHVIRQYPQYANQIHMAQTAGYGADFILKHIASPKNKNSKNADDFLTEHEKIHKRSKDRKKRAALVAVGALGTAGALAASAGYLNRGNGVIQPSEILPAQKIGKNQLQIGSSQQQLQLPAIQGKGPQKPQGPTTQSPVQPHQNIKQQPPEPKLTVLSPEKSINLVRNLKEEDKFDSIIRNNDFDVKTTSSVLRSLLPKVKVDLMDKAEGGLEKIVEDYSKFLKSPDNNNQNQLKPQKPTPIPSQNPPETYENQQSQPQQPNQPKPPMDLSPGISSVLDKTINSQKMQQAPKNLIQSEVSRDVQKSVNSQVPTNELEDIDRKKRIEPIRKMSENIIITPDGIGEIKHSGKKGVIAKVNGKDKSFFEKDVEKPSEDVIEAVSNILKIPEVDRSSIVSLFTYDPEDAKMYIQYHNGETYKYSGVDPEIVHNIANKMGIPVTKGKNIFGAWSPEDKESLGAALIQQLLKDPKFAKPKKGDPENPNYKKLDTMYDYWKDLRKKPKQKK